MVKFLIIFFSFFWFNFLLSQSPVNSDLLEFSDKDVVFNKRTSINAPLLVSKLIKNKNGDREKFDAIFTWVTSNIKYDYSEFYLPTTFNPNTISRILKNKRTICLGYSNLMDTLCKLAGITNVTVYGYAKDGYFDVNDTIYVHNHAWNAVKLDNLWYLYDATWSKGKVEYEYTPMAKIIMRWFEKHPVKLKKKKLRNKFNHHIKDICDLNSANYVYYYKRRWLSQFFHNIVALLPIRVKKVFKKGITKDYYLSDPNLFSITHLPDDPIWNLGDSRTFRELETDSAYYYFNDSILKNQTRQGFECVECDRYVELNTKAKLKILNERSKKFNNHNSFITTLCENQIASINFKQGYFETDSLEKMQYIDSAITSYANTYYSLKKSKDDIKKMTLMHKTKNKHKMNLLISDNKIHNVFMSSKVKQTLKHKTNYNILISQSGAYAYTYLKKSKRVKHFKIDIKTDKLKPFPEKTISNLYKNLTKKQQKLDSLVRIIKDKQIAFDSLLVGISLNIWQQVKYHDSISLPFIKSIKLRRKFNDNYKKVIIDVRKTIPGCKLTYETNLNSIIYNPSDIVFSLFKEIVSLIKSKSKLQKECLEYNRELLRAKEFSYDEVNTFKGNVINDSKSDFCWLASNYSKLGTTLYGLAILSNLQYQVIDLINTENDIERNRNYIFNHGMQIGYRETLKALAFEIRDVKKALKGVKKYKKNYIKRIKK